MTLFCDFDGPIVDVSNRYYSTYRLALSLTQRLFQDQGITLPVQLLSKDQFWQLKQERTPDPDIALRSGLYQANQVEAFMQNVSDLVNQPALLHQDNLQPGVQWALAMLYSRGVQLVLVTLRCQEQATQILRDHGLVHYFSHIWGTVDATAAYANQAERKTHLLREAIAGQHRRERHLGDVWMVGDTEADILAGHAVGLPTIALTCGIRSPRYLKNFQPTLVQPNLLSAATYLLRRHTACVS